MLPTKQPRTPDDPAEYEHFLDTARKVEVDESPEAFDRAFTKVVRPAKKDVGRGKIPERA